MVAIGYSVPCVKPKFVGLPNSADGDQMEMEIYLVVANVNKITRNAIRCVEIVINVHIL